MNDSSGHWWNWHSAVPKAGLRRGPALPVRLPCCSLSGHARGRSREGVSRLVQATSGLLMSTPDWLRLCLGSPANFKMSRRLACSPARPCRAECWGPRAQKRSCRLGAATDSVRRCPPSSTEDVQHLPSIRSCCIQVTSITRLRYCLYGSYGHFIGWICQKGSPDEGHDGVISYL